jgi:hypothetical protein
MQLPTRYVKLDAARQRHGDRVERFGRFFLVGDRHADAVVNALGSLPRTEREALIQQCFLGNTQQRTDLHPEVKTLFAEIEHVPYWVDFERIDRGCRAFLNAGLLGGIVLGALSLVAGYCSPAGNKPLMFSGRLVSDVSRRLAETSRFVEVVSKPGGLRPGAEGLRACVKVRLMHATIRCSLMRSPKWDTGSWGVAINQCDSAGTLLLFSHSVLNGLDKLGHVMSPTEREDFLHLWRYAGYLMGVEHELLCSTEQEAAAQWDLLSTTQDPPDDDARTLARSLIESGALGARTEDERSQIEKRVRFAYALSRYLIGDDYADALEFPRWPMENIFPVFRVVNQRIGGRVRAFSLTERFAFEAGKRYWRDVTRAALKGVPAAFTVTEDVVTS